MHFPLDELAKKAGFTPLTIKEHFHEIVRAVEEVVRKYPENTVLSNGLSMLKKQVMPIIECGLREVGHKE